MKTLNYGEFIYRVEDYRPRHLRWRLQRANFRVWASSDAVEAVLDWRTYFGAVPFQAATEKGQRRTGLFREPIPWAQLLERRRRKKEKRGHGRYSWNNEARSVVVRPCGPHTSVVIRRVFRRYFA